MSSLFLTQAHALGQRLAGGALRHGGRATWLADSFHQKEEVWYPAVSTLDGDLASGTAGVATFLAHLSRATNDPGLQPIAVEALRHSLTLAEGHATAGRLGWYRGSLGIAWAAIVNGRLLGRSDLEEEGARLASRAIDAARHSAPDPGETGVLGVSTDLLAGLLAASLLELPAATEAAHEHASRLAATRSAASDQGAAVGLARGDSGLGLLLAAWSATGGAPSGAQTAVEAFDRERAWFEPGAGWWAPSAHGWLQAPPDLTRSWCSGAAGIGLARLVGHAATRETILLAEVGAAVELVRQGTTRLDAADASVCHGACGEIELLLVAGQILAEPAHHEAARRTGQTLVESARLSGGYGSGYGPDTKNPSLLLGLAGTGLTLLRLHDPRSAPSPALPPVLGPGLGGSG